MKAFIHKVNLYVIRGYVIVDDTLPTHYDDVIMDSIASQITSLTIVYSTAHLGADQSKNQSSASLAFVWEIHRWPVNFPHKWPVTRKMFPFVDVIMHLDNSVHQQPKFQPVGSSESKQFANRRQILLQIYKRTFWMKTEILFAMFILSTAGDLLQRDITKNRYSNNMTDRQHYKADSSFHDKKFQRTGIVRDDKGRNQSPVINKACYVVRLALVELTQWHPTI